MEEAGLRIEHRWEYRGVHSSVECRAVFPANGDGEGGKINGLRKLWVSDMSVEV